MRAQECAFQFLQGHQQLMNGGAEVKAENPVGAIDGADAKVAAWSPFTPSAFIQLVRITT